MGDVRHNCSISVTHNLPDAYDFLKAQDHRGPDASGIGALRADGLVDTVTWTGSIGAFDIEGLQELFPNTYTFFFSHGRYATRGSDVPLLDEAHPITIGGEHYPNHAENGRMHRIVRGARAAVIHNGQVPSLGYTDLETRVDSEQLLRYYLDHGPERTMRDVALAYTAVFADASGLRVMRDRSGIKPGVLGVKNRREYVVASEDVAIRKNHARVVENLEPGTIYELHPDRMPTKTRVLEPQTKRCFFEWMYISHLDTILDDRSVRSLREHVGRTLADEIAPDADFVTFLPRSPETAARSYANARGLDFETVFYKLNKKRSFLEPNQKAREKSIEKNLFIKPEMRDVLEGRRVIIIDDSIVRGTNSRHLSKLLSNTGVEHAYLLSCTPRIGIIGDDGEPRGCEWGVDMPPDSEFIARDADTAQNRSARDISRIVGLDVRYLSVDGLKRSYQDAGINPETLCTFCIGGPRP